MAGPVASILVPAPLADGTAEYVRDEALRRASAIDGDDFWLQGRPFIFAGARKEVETLDQITTAHLTQLLGWTPVCAATIAAMCNSEIDHRLLGEVCARLADVTQGIVDFGGQIAVAAELDVSTLELPARLESPGGLPGVLLIALHETADSQYAATHFGDARFMRSWLDSPAFRMVK